MQFQISQEANELLIDHITALVHHAITDSTAYYQSYTTKSNIAGKTKYTTTIDGSNITWSLATKFVSQKAYSTIRLDLYERSMQKGLKSLLSARQ